MKGDFISSRYSFQKTVDGDTCVDAMLLILICGD